MSTLFESSQVDRRLTALCLIIAAIAVGQGVQVANGNLHPESIRWLTIGCVFTFLGVVAPTHRFIEQHAEPLIVTLAGLGIAYQFTQLVTAMPGMYLRLAGLPTLVPFYSGLVVSAVLIGSGLSKKPWLGTLQLPLLLLAFIFLGRWLIQTSPAPFIDVFVFQRDGANALLTGHNPYALRYPDIYGNSPFYGEGLSVNGVLQFGYPYFPLSLLLALPGHVLFGDYRYSQLAAMVISAGLIATARPGRLGFAAAALMLFTPRAFFVLEQGWTEPYVVMGALAGGVHRVPFLQAVTLGAGRLHRHQAIPGIRDTGRVVVVAPATPAARSAAEIRRSRSCHRRALHGAIFSVGPQRLLARRGGAAGLPTVSHRSDELPRVVGTEERRSSADITGVHRRQHRCDVGPVAHAAHAGWVLQPP